MATPRVITGLFPVQKPCPYAADGAWVGFQIEADPTVDLLAGEVRGFQGLVRAWPADPTTYAKADSSDAFVVTLTRAADAINAAVGGDLAQIKALLDTRIAASGIAPRPVYGVGLGGGALSVAYDPATLTLADADLDAIGLGDCAAPGEDAGHHGDVLRSRVAGGTQPS